MTAPAILVDGHMHVHESADVSVLLSAAAKNFASLAARLGCSQWQGLLLLCDMVGQDWFGALEKQGGTRRYGEWQVSCNGPGATHALASRGDTVLHIVAGRQLATSERLEVLAIGTRAQLPDGAELEETIAAAQATGALVVLPWAVGKWLGNRGMLVRKAFLASRECPIFAGDNGGRPGFWREPEVFTITRSRGLPVLPGTDPLPLPGEHARVGSFGFWLNADLPRSLDGPALQRLFVEAGAAGTHPFGPHEMPWQFVRNQISLRRRGT